MPTITFPKDDLKRFIKGDVDDDTIREAITMLGTDIDAFGEDVTVEIFPNRPDLLSVQGLARALNHFLGSSTDVDTYDTEMGPGDVRILPTAADARPHTRCAIIRGLALDDATIKHIIDVQEKLHVTFGRRRKRVAIGIYPLEHITLPITFGAEKPEDIVFRPLEADAEMDANQLLQDHPVGKRYAHLLDGLDLYPVFRDSEGKVLSVPPIINSHDIGRITEETTDVFIECSGHDPKPLQEALIMICAVLSDIGGTIERMRIVYPDKELYTPDMSTKKARIDASYVAQRAGIPADRLKSSLQRMGIGLEDDTVTIPCYRTDFQHDVDIVEDALIGYGYQNIQGRIPQATTIGRLSNTHVRDRALRDILSGLGLVEVMNYFLVPDGVALANPLNENFSALRTDLLAGLLDVLEENTSTQYPQHIFELGHVFSPDAQTDTKVAENEHLCVLLCGEDADYTSCRQTLEAVARAFGWRLGFEEHDDDRFIAGRCARISGAVTGVIGEIHPRELAERNVTQPAAAFEIDLE